MVRANGFADFRIDMTWTLTLPMSHVVIENAFDYFAILVFNDLEERLRGDETEVSLRRYCEALALWKTCHRKQCRRGGTCRGDIHACLAAALDRVAHAIQWRARQDILAATPPNAGAPERAARRYMPRDFYEGSGGEPCLPLSAGFPLTRK
jgi:hypothetical protein